MSSDKKLPSDDQPLPRYEGIPVARPSFRRVQVDAYLDFGRALVAMKTGRRVGRATWNGCSITLVDNKSGRDAQLNLIELKTAQGDLRSNWTAEAEDLLAEDWYITTESK